MIRIIGLVFAFIAYANALHLGTYNVENLFDDIAQGREYREYIPGNKHGWNSKMAFKKLSNTAYAISKMEVDILGIQEIENETLLAKLAQETNFPYYAFAGSRGAPSGVGLLSQYPIRYSKPITSPQSRVRASLHVKLDIHGDELEIIVVHWPSLNNPNHFREAAARAIAPTMQKMKEGIVMGDFNDPFSSKSIASKMWAPLETYEDWFDPWMGVYPKWSHDFFGQKKALDRMLLSEGLFDGKGWEFKCGSFKPLLKKPFLKDGIPHRWEISDRGKGEHQGEGYSDHLPLVLELSKSPFTCNAKRVHIKDLFSQKTESVNLEIKRAIVLYNHHEGMVVGDESSSIHVYEPGFSLPIGSIVDLHVSALGEFFGMREIRALHVSHDYGQKGDANALMLPFSRLMEAKGGDVMRHVEGVVKKGKLHTKYGTIDLYVKPNFAKPKEGQKLELKRVRVSEYRGRIQLILEERE
jgi:endonuclease/exonuclease/phosphatase family metal-dependent hydrolase